MSDIFEKITELNLSGDTYESEQRYRLIIAVGTFICGWLWLPWSAILWVVTLVKIKNYLGAKK